MPFSPYTKNQVLNEITGRTNTLNLGDNIYIGLATAAPVLNADGTASSSNEPSGNGYARKWVGTYNNSASLVFGSSASNGSISNTQEIHFNMATGSWGTLTTVILFDAATNGHVLAWGTLNDSISPVQNSVPVIQANGFTLSITDPSESA